MSFASLALSDALVRAVTEQGYTTPTPIQLQAIPAVLQGGDLLAGAHTATGQTAGVVLRLKTPLRVYASDQTHSSIEKGVKIAGFGRENLRLVPTDEAFAMIPEKLEEVVLDWLRQMLGLPSGFSGVIQDTASTATLCALLSAREKATGFEGNESGLREPLVVYASEEAHSSVDKGVRIAGLGRKNLRRIPTDDRFALIPEKLAEAVARDREAGLVPACVVATVGTTSSGAVDPLKEIGAICRAHNPPSGPAAPSTPWR